MALHITILGTLLQEVKVFLIVKRGGFCSDVEWVNPLNNLEIISRMNSRRMA